MCLADPENLLMVTTCKGKHELLSILNHLNSLKYEDRPSYNLIRKLLTDMKKKEFVKQSNAVKFNWINNNSCINYHINAFTENVKKNLYNNFTLDSSLYIINPEQSNNNFSTNNNSNSFQNFLNSFQLNLTNSTNNSSTVNNNFGVDNFTGLNNFYNRVGGTFNQDCSIKQPLKKKRKRIILKEECIQEEPCSRMKRDREDCEHDDVDFQIPITTPNNSSSRTMINNNLVPIQNYFLFVENLKHLKKPDQVPFYFPHNVGGVPGFAPFMINPEGRLRNESCLCFDKDGNPYTNRL